ncbi:hypothetical protein D4764_17G0002380 [Takifugu flavidus]|uniref:Uncharacterized protein n=1 Tax=Takifugu flavidus TaxID=433684 RepID=A0A5C6NUV2_9TELE|nr:hypothetical protein D4764_17G0002380 [Takifugu flavidus]
MYTPASWGGFGVFTERRGNAVGIAGKTTADVMEAAGQLGSRLERSASPRMRIGNKRDAPTCDRDQMQRDTRLNVIPLFKGAFVVGWK